MGVARLRLLTYDWKLTWLSCLQFHLRLSPRVAYRNPSFGLATKAKGIARVRAKEDARELSQEERSPGVKAKALQECGPRGSPGVKARGSPGVTSHTPGSVRKCEGVSPHTPKATPTWGDGVLVDSRNFREWFQGSNLNGWWHSLYHWKALEA
jgi:hypothetical protein